MIVYVAEKPSVAKEIAKLVGANQRHDGYLSGNGVAVTWAFGHLVSEQSPEKYSEAWEQWSLDSLPMIPKPFKLEVHGDSGVRKQFKIIMSLFDQASEVICATDAGREGELIFRNIYDFAGCTKPMKRLWASSLTDEALTKALNDLRPGVEYDNLASAARCRAQADWLVGLNATRGYTKKFSQGGVLSVGRVQTPVLAMIVKRCQDIQGFVSSPFWECVSIYKETQFKAKRGRFTDENEAKGFVEKLQDQEHVIEEVEAREKKEKAPLLYDLTELQRDMNKRYKWSAENTLKMLQTLYESKYVTYPRTDSAYLSKDMLQDVKDTLQLISKTYAVASEADATLKHRAFNDAKVTDHHAILPTQNFPEDLNEDLETLYKAICQRFIAAFMPDCIKLVTTVKATVSTEKFEVKGIAMKQIGWRKMYPAGEKKDTVLPLFNQGEKGSSKIELKKGKTTPPKLYTEGTLLTAMEGAGKVIEDEEMKEAMKERGLGTPATRATIIENLIKRKYIERKKGNLEASKMGVALIGAIGWESPLTSPEMTGDWEAKLKQMEKGEQGNEDFMSSIECFVNELVTDLKQRKGNPSLSASTGKQPLAKCPECGADIFEQKMTYTCSPAEGEEWKTKNCNFVIWKKISGKKISVAVAKKICSTGKSNLIDGFLSKAEKTFKAHLVWDNKAKRITFEFEKKKAKK